MRNKNRKVRFSPLAILISAVLLASGGALKTDAAVLLSDGMDYASTTAFRNSWLSEYGNGNRATETFYGPSPLAGLNDTPASGTFASLGNRVLYRQLAADTVGNWSLSAKLLISNYQRNLGVFLLNETGTQGYGMVWDSNIVNQLGGNGRYQIRKFDNLGHTSWASFGLGVTLGSQMNGGHPITGYPVTVAPNSDANAATYDTASWADFVSLRLEWSAADGVLSLYENEVLMGQRTDINFTSFRRIYLRGNDWGFVDDIQLTGSFGESYAVWAASYPTLIGEEADDDDNDGLSNLEEFAFGGNPTNASDVGYAPTTRVSGDFFEVVHVRRTAANNLLYYLEQDEDLVAGPEWIRSGGYEVSGEGPFPADPAFEVVTNRISLVNKSQEFTRLGVGLRSDPFSYPLFNTNTFGATVPFITLEGEEGSSNGSMVQLGTPFPWPSTPAQEASGRAFIELANTGEYVEFNVPADANTFLIRHCIPDAPGGGGITNTLSLYVNGVEQQDVTLSSKFNWLYVTNGIVGGNGQSNTPNGFPHVFWDETRLFLSSDVEAGDVIRLQKDAGDTAAYYRIDLVELEMVGPPLSQPPNSLSVATYGANGSSAGNDTAAIEACIADAKAQGKIVWFPAGDYLQNAYFELDGVKVQGAGMWYTTLYETVGDASINWHANAGFKFFGSGSSVSDMSFDSLVNTFRSPRAPKPFTGLASNWSIERVWITHTGTGIWIVGPNGVIRDCRIRFTYADGINVNDGGLTFGDTSDVLIENNHVRGTGDDGIAILDHESSPDRLLRMTIRHNTIVGDWSGASIDLTGGMDHLIHNNLLMDGAGFVVNLPPAYPMESLTNTLFSYNQILRCGNKTGADVGSERGSIWIFPGSSDLQNLRIENNVLNHSLYQGIHIFKTEIQEVTFKNNRIYNSGREAVFISGQARGTGTFDGNISTNSGAQPFRNNAAAGDYTVIDQGNNVWN